MSAPLSSNSKPPNTLAILSVLGLVQFTHIVDFMIMMPLGPHLMRVFQITPRAFSQLVAAYGVAAAITGFLAAFFVDRFDRKRALLFLFGGFGLGTLLCALAPGYWTMFFARTIAGGFGGVAGSVVVAIVGDLVPPEKRGTALGAVMSAFPLASIMGVPAGLWLANVFEWHAPFFMLAGCAAIILLVAARVLPDLHGHRVQSPPEPLAQMRAILGQRNHQRGLLLSAVLVASGAVIIPFMAPSMVANVGLSEAQLPLIYLFGGACTLLTMNLVGRLSDRFDKLHVLAWVSVASVAAALIITHLRPVPLTYALLATTFFMIGMSSRFAPAMAMITNAVEPRYRGGFMSVNSAVQQVSSGASALIGGIFVTSDANGRLVGYPSLGWISVAFAAATLFLAWRLRSTCPESAHVRRATVDKLAVG